MDKRKTIMSCTTLDELLDVEYGEVGTKMRDEFNLETEAFCQEQTNREERLRVDSSQET
jgi:hypothetical protein